MKLHNVIPVAVRTTGALACTTLQFNESKAGEQKDPIGSVPRQIDWAISLFQVECLGSRLLLSFIFPIY